MYSPKVMSCYLSVVAGMVVRHGDLSHEMALLIECDNINRV